MSAGGTLLLGIDVGTASSKAVLTDHDGTVLARHAVSHGMSVPRSGWAEQDAERVWWHDVRALCTRLLDGSPYTGSDVAGVAVSAIGPCLLPLDEHDEPLRPGILYGVDTRASDQIRALEREIGEDAVFAFSRSALTSQSVGPKIRWLRESEPDVWARTRRLTTASSYLVAKLTGEHVIDRHTASHFAPLIDMDQLEWSERYAAHVGPIERLPRLAWSDEVAGTVTQAAAEATGLRAGTPVAVGTVDAVAEGLSVGVTRPGDLMVMYGSTTFFVLMVDAPIPDRRTWATAGPFAGTWALAAGMGTTGSLTAWLRDLTTPGVSDDDAFETLFEGAARVPPGAEGLLMLPYFSGERTPLNDPHARGVIAGLSLAHGRDQLFRAALEGIAYGVRHNLETFDAIGAPVTRIVAVGGGARGIGAHIVSDVTGRTQQRARVSIGAAYGDAFIAGLSAGILQHDDLERWVTIERTIEPDSAAARVYDERYPDFLDLYRSTKPIVHRLGAHQAPAERPTRRYHLPDTATDISAHESTHRHPEESTRA